MTKDPVCGMQVDERTAKDKTQHDGKTYAFCSPGCKTKFEQRPENYTRKDTATARSTR